ncbi:MAG: hypothetical protein PHS34_08585, partial [Candidatus Omnitrophica bacterium]|nr:hypothetical protein [Candidatus Omnitrophota bacterium]
MRKKKIVITPKDAQHELKKRKIIKRCEESYIEFCKEFLLHHFSFPEEELRNMELKEKELLFTYEQVQKYKDKYIPQKHDAEMFTIFKSIFDGNIVYVALIEPRGLGKSTKALGLILWLLAYKKRKFIIYIGDSADKVERQIMTLKLELLSNEKLIDCFPHLKPLKSRLDNRFVSFSKNLILLETSVIAMTSTGTSPRGYKIKNQRPDFVLLDDLENHTHVSSENNRRKLRSWLLKKVMPLGGTSGASFLYLGTIIHNDSLLANIEKGFIPRFNVIKHAIWDENENSIWDVFYPTKRIYSIRDEILGPSAFSSEYLNKPKPEGVPFFEEEMIKRSTFKFERFASALSPDNLYCYMDVATTVKGDYCSLALGYGEERDIYLIDWICKKLSVDQAIKYVIDYQKKWGFQILGVEENFAKQLIYDLEEEFEREGINILIKSIWSSKNKEMRIISILQNKVENGTLHFAEDYWTRYQVIPTNKTHHPVQQLLDFPYAKYDDAPDTLAGLVDMYRKFVANFNGISLNYSNDDSYKNKIINFQSKELQMYKSDFLEAIHENK